MSFVTSMVAQASFQDTQPLLPTQQANHGSTSSEIIPLELDPLKCSEGLTPSFEEAETRVKLSNLSKEDMAAVLEAIERFYRYIKYHVDKTQRIMFEIKSYLDSVGVNLIMLQKSPWLIDSINFSNPKLEDRMSELGDQVSK